MSISFEQPSNVQFSCTQCGDCCRNANVMLMPGEAERLRALDWHGREADLEGKTTIVSTAMPDGHRVQRLARRDDRSCVYLGADNRCRIHRHFGGETKPLVCRIYPFAFYPVANRVAVDCAFSCRSISEGSGDSIAARIPEWSALLSETAKLDERRHRLNRQRALTGDLLWEFEHYLLGFLADVQLSLIDRVRCCLQFNRLATTGDPTTQAAAQLRQGIARGLPKQISAIPRGEGMDRTQRVIFYQWLFLTLNPMPVNADLLSGADRKRLDESRIAAARRFGSQEATPWIDNRELSATWEQIAAVDASIVSAASAPLLERYLAAKIVGQRFLVAGEEELPLVEAVPLFFLSYPMAIWTARALAADQGKERVDEADLRRAIGLLDRALGQVPLSALSPKAAKTWHFVVEETDLVVEATNELVPVSGGL